MAITKNILLVLLGVILTIVLFCTIVGIASAVNDITFGEQICQWFGKTAEVVTDTSEKVEEITTSGI